MCTLNPGFRSPRSESEVGFIVCPCALGCFFTATTYTLVLSCPVFMSSSFCPCCAHTCTFVLTLVFLASPRGRRVRNLLGLSRGPRLPGACPGQRRPHARELKNVPAIVKLLVHVPGVVLEVFRSSGASTCLRWPPTTCVDLQPTRSF